MDKYFELAIDNVTKFGDTDIFPFPIENNIFFDLRKDTINLLRDMHKDFDIYLSDTPPVNHSTLCPTGYSGFRWGTHIDPVWNLYFLSLVLSIADEIEKKRISTKYNKVFSYRFLPNYDSGKLFDDECSWREFQLESINQCEDKSNKFILICDIADFYSRIYFHRLENAMNNLRLNVDSPSRIMKLLKNFTGNVSYGLPIGGNAARILSELVLNSTDKLLEMNKVKFCRYADDYHIFASSMEEAYEKLILISEFLLKNEGLAIQKSKTRLMTVEEYKLNSEIYKTLEDGEPSQKVQFLRINLKFDPYSESAIEDYEELKKKISEFDILGMLKSELNNKSQIHRHLVSRLLKAISLLSPSVQLEAVLSILDSIQILSPLYVQIMQLIYKVFDSLDSNAQEIVQGKIREIVNNKHYLLKIDLNLHYTVLVIGKLQCPENEQILTQIYNDSKSYEPINKDIILIFAKWNTYHWISNIKNKFGYLGHWEKKTFLIASYILNDEGNHWRKHIDKNLTNIDRLYVKWANTKKVSGKMDKLI